MAEEIKKEKTAEEAKKEHDSEMDDKGFYALHPFSLSCEAIWDHDVTMWFTTESYADACAEV